MHQGGNSMIEKYIAYSREVRNHPYSEETEKAIRRGLGQFFEWWGAKPLEEFDREALSEFKEYLWSIRQTRGGNKGYSINTVNQRLIILRKFCEVCRDDWGIHVKAHPMAETVEIQNIEAGLLEISHVRAMAKTARREDALAYILILGLFYTGARISEILQVRCSDVGRPEILIKGKGRKYRNLFIPARLSNAWRAYVRNHCLPSQTYLYSINSDEAMTRNTAYYRILKAGKSAAVSGRRIHPHAFRHLYARVLQDGGVPTAIIKQILGHRLDVTESYLQFSRERLMEIVEAVKL